MKSNHTIPPLPFFLTFIALLTSSYAVCQNVTIEQKLGDPRQLRERSVTDRLRDIHQEIGDSKQLRDKPVTDRLNDLDQALGDGKQLRQNSVTGRLKEIDERTKNQEGSVAKIARQVKGVGFNADRFWVLLAAVLVFFMQAGFKCLEVGMVQPKFDGLQASQKLFSWISTYAGYFLVGFGIMFGPTLLGFVGHPPYGPTEVVNAADAQIQKAVEQGKTSGQNRPDTNNDEAPADPVRGLEFFLFQAAFAATAVTIPAGATAERLGLKGYIWTGLFIAALVYPVFGHLAWGGSIYTADVLKNHPDWTGWLQRRKFHDFAGSTVVHSVGAGSRSSPPYFCGRGRGASTMTGC